MKITEKQFASFRDHVYKWQKSFGLLDWEIYVDRGDDNDCEATCDIEKPNMIATIHLCNIGDNDVKRAALHEILEIVLTDVGDLLLLSGYSEDKVEEELHKIIRRIENVIYPK